MTPSLCVGTKLCVHPGWKESDRQPCRCPMRASAQEPKLCLRGRQWQNAARNTQSRLSSFAGVCHSCRKTHSTGIIATQTLQRSVWSQGFTDSQRACDEWFLPCCCQTAHPAHFEHICFPWHCFQSTKVWCVKRGFNHHFKASKCTL